MWYGDGARFINWQFYLYRYEGEYKNDLREGRGTLYEDGNRLRRFRYLFYTRYEGEWKNHEENGRGILYLANGDRFLINSKMTIVLL
jgi:hypothetical protein